MSTKSRQPRDPTEDIKKAVEKLAAFNQQNEDPTLGSLEKTIGLMRDFLSVKFSDKNRHEQTLNRKKNENEILNAIDILKSNYLILEKLQKGTPQQQKWAASIAGVIERYNSIIDKAQHKPVSFADRIAAYLAEKNGCVQIKGLAKIHFPFHTKVHRDYSDKEEKKYSPKIESPFIAAASKKVSDLSQIVVPLAPLPTQNIPHLSKQALELFNMKVIALVEKHGILSNTEARQAVRTSHLQTVVHPDLSTCTVTCTLFPFPGQTITVTGSFEKSPRSGDYAIPNSKSFHLALTCAQTGFPHPLQHTGNALPDLVPQYPHHLAELPLLKPLYERKLKIAHELLSNEKLIAKAKHLQKLKKEAFEKDRENLINLHRQASSVFVMSVPCELFLENSIEIITEFYAQLSQIHNPYHYLAETHHIINENFAVRPQEKLKQAWVERGKVDFAPHQIMEREVSLVLTDLDYQWKETKEFEKSTIAYMQIMGQVLAHCSRNIILQHLSEGMDFAPPVLNDFERKVQTIAYKQLRQFLDELELVTPDMNLLLTERLMSELSIWESPFEEILNKDLDAQISRELEVYYNSRHVLKNQ